MNLCRFNNDWAGLVREGTVHEITGLIGAFEIEPVKRFAVLKAADIIFTDNTRQCRADARRCHTGGD